MKVPVLRPAVLLGILSLTALAARAGVTFSNVSAVQRPGTKLVDIFYDVASTETNLVSVSLAVGDGTSEVDVTNVTGAVGEGVATGAGKTIVWDAGADWGGHAAVLSYTVMADDGSGAANGANVQKFTSSGTFVPPVGVTSVEVLVVAGGGGGGSDAGGGGGAGGLIYDPSYSVTGSVAVVVGAGGTSGVQYTVPKSGQNSVFGSLVAIGGGAGAYYFANNALPGGSGGGAVVNGVGLGKAAAGTPGQGYAGSASGGGGGAGAPAPSKNGGVGLYFVQFAAAGGAPAGWFAGGGGGGGGPAGAGGLGGGADGEGGVASKNAPANTGGGGGGGYAGGPGAIGGNGGSGIVLVRYAASGGASATSCATDTRDYTLTVASAHGAPVPAAGTHTYAWRATVACGAGTESGYTCTGWSGTGSVPGSGGTDNAGSITLDAVDSSITWNWLAHATVSNVSAVQRPGTKLVDILYDLASSGGKPETVSLVVRDGGTEVCVTNLTGAVGAGITPGAGKAIVWDAGADWGGNVAVLNFTVAAGDALADGACHVQKFTADGTFVPPAGVTAVGVLVVAGGGGGGSDAGGGGGAGGLIYNPAYTVTGSVAVVVGAGGTSGVQYTVPKSGQNSAFGSLVSIGGGAGAYYYANNALPGGSGGGAVVNGAGPGRAAAGTPGQGHAGSASGGGGGAGAPAPGKNGGDGLDFVQFAAAGGSPAGWFAGGGGGGGGPAGAGGLGGGADGEGGAAPKNAPANTGGGGGGGYAGGPGAVGGNGGSGIVLVRYPATGTAGVSSCATDTRDYTLAVASAHGAPVPAAGTHTYAWHAVVTCGAGLDDDYTCTGWTGTGSVPVSGGSGSAGNITLEDVSSSISWQWQTGTNTVFCRVTFDAAGGAVAPAFMTVAQGAPCGALPVPALAGHSFRGWWSAPGAAGLLVTDATVMTNLPEQTLFARYIQNPVVTSRTPLADPAPVNEGASVMLKLTAGDGTDPDFAARGMSNVTWLVDGVRVLETRTGAPNAISSAYTLRTATNTVVGAAFRDITVTAVAYDVQGGRTDTAWTVRVNNVPAAQTVSFPSLAARTLGDEDFIPVASASTKLPVTLASSNTSVAQIIDGWVHIVGAGTAVITASQPGTFDFRAAAPVSQTLTVKARLATEVPSGGGTVSGAGLYLPGAKVALAAKPSAGFTFLRWEDGSQMAVRSLVMPNANITARAWFGSTSNVPPPDVTDPGAVRAMVGVPFRLALDITSASLPAVTVAGLPPGLAYVAATKTVAGVPTAPVSNRTVTVTARNVNATPVTRTFVMTVDPLPLWAQGAFSGAAGTDALGAGSASMHVTAKGAVSGKITLRGTNFNFSAKSYTARGGDGAFSLVTTAKVGKVAWPLTVAVNVPEITDTTGTVPPTLSKAEGVLNAEGWATLYRNIWKDPGMAAVLTNRFAGYYTATLPGGREYGSGYLTFTVDRLGGVKAAGKLADGTAVSLSGTLVLDEAGRTFAVLYAAPAAYAGGGLFGLVEFLQTSEGAKVIVRPLDGEPLLWESLNPLATGDYRAGFEREPGLSGGWYDTLGNLYAYYAGTSLTMETEHAPVPELLVGANRFESACWDPDGLGLAVVTNRFGVMTGLAAPKAGVPVKVGAAYDYAAPTNALGLTVALARATGVFKGSFKAWFDYAATHTPKTLLYEGVLTPEREDMGDGVAGRGFFLWADKSQYLNPQGRPVPYAFSWSYDLKILLAEAPPQRL